MTARVFTGLLATQSDQRLVELAGRGHERAFEVLVKRYRKPLLRYCARMGLSAARGEDAVQQTLLQAWLAIQRGVEVRELRPWLYRITHNTAVNAMRAPLLERPLSDAAQIAPAHAPSDPEHRIAVRAALGDVAALPQMQRDAILLAAINGRSHEEVASTLGISEGAVRGLLYRARATLRAAAAAIMPPPLLAWACAHAARSAQCGGGLPELTAAGGAAGVGGALLKGAAIAVSTAAIVAGTAVHLHRPARPRDRSDTHAVSPAERPTHSRGAGTQAAAGARTSIRLLADTGTPAHVLGSSGRVRALAPALRIPASVWRPGSGSRPPAQRPSRGSGFTPAAPLSPTAVTPSSQKAAQAPGPSATAAGVEAPPPAGATPAPATTPPASTEPPPVTKPPPATEPPDDHEPPSGEKPPAGKEPPEKELGDGGEDTKRPPAKPAAPA